PCRARPRRDEMRMRRTQRRRMRRRRQEQATEQTQARAGFSRWSEPDASLPSPLFSLRVSFQPRRDILILPNVTNGLASPHDGGLFPVHQHLGRDCPRVIVGGHHGAIRARAQQRHAIALLEAWERTVVAKEIARFANRPYHVRTEQRAIFATEWNDLV